MDFEVAGRFIVIKFKTIDDLINVNGDHPIKVVLSDYEYEKTEYRFNIRFKVPQRLTEKK